MSRNRSSTSSRSHRQPSDARAAAASPPRAGTSSALAPELTERAEALAREMRGLRLAAVRARYSEVFERPTRSKNRADLIGRIAGELARRELADAADRAAQPARVAPSAQAPRRGRRGRFSGMSIDQLQALYTQGIGRETSSTDRRYLEWKLREAAKGRITVGPLERSSGITETGEMMTLPWRLPRALVEAMDAGWRSLHFKSRSAFLAAAVGSLFDAKGDRALARRFGVAATDAA